MKKYLSISVATLSFLLSYSEIASANKWSASLAWGPQAASYAPDYGNTSMYEYTATDGSLQVSPKARFRFTSDAITAIRNYRNNEDRFYTFDISLTDQNNTSMSAYTMTTYLPNPHYDFDDDPEPFGNGFFDETEVTSLSPEQIVANTDYRQEAWFKINNRSTVVYFEFGSQESARDFLSGEYNPGPISPHIQRRYPF